MDEKINSRFTKVKESVDDLHHTMINFIVAFEEIKELKRTKGE